MMNRSKLWEIANRLNGGYRFRLLPIAMKILLRPGPDAGLVRLGTRYGGWWIPSRCLRPGAVAFCAGAGEDISFDLALLDKGLNVIVFDPTPRAIEYVERTAPKHERFKFLAIGWWDTPGLLKFYAPRIESHVSHSVVNLQGTDNFFEAEVAPVSQLSVTLGHTDIELIKMDIEGAEHAVLDDIIRNGPRPVALCVEFDQPERASRTISAVRRLRREGYILRRIEGWNYTFARSE